MKEYQPVKTGWELEKYKRAIAENKEDEVFLGDGEFMIRHRESYFEDITDIDILIRYCLFPLYEEGDVDIVCRTEKILKNFVASGEINKLYQVLLYFTVQSDLTERYKRIPFVIDIKEFVPSILKNITNLADIKGNKKLSLLISWMTRLPEFREYDNEAVENILSIRQELANKPQEGPSLEEIFPIELEPTKIDAIGIVEGQLEILLIDSNKWRKPLEKQHLLKLQEKINNYIHFLESKQYVEKYGDNFKEKVIHIAFQYAPSDNGLAFLVQVQKVLQSTDMSLKVTLPD